MGQRPSCSQSRPLGFRWPSILLAKLILLSKLVGGGSVAEEFHSVEYARHRVHICRYHDQQQAAEFGIELEGDERRYAPDRTADILHLRLDVTPDFQQRTISGTTRIEFQPIARPLDEITLHAVDLQIHAVRADRAVADHVNTRKTLTIHFAEPIPVGKRAFVEIDHTAQPVKGFYFRTPEMGYPAEDIHVWTQGETHEARYWFPCFDYPNERSTTEVICHVPPEMTVLSNGRLVEESVDPQGLKRVHWRQEIPHVNYLLCLVAGKFHKLEKRHRDIPLAFYAQPSLAAHAANAFADTDKIMAFFEQEIGMPFPWNKYDQVTIMDFIAGGMENTSLTTLTDHTIYSSEFETLRPAFPLDAHEMAHQWFGDYVTCKDWGHLWLNEGFATYYTHLYSGHRDGPDAMLYGLYRDATDRILPNSQDTRGIVYRDYKNPQEQFDYRSYPKGSWVLHMLRSQLGADLYRAAIRDYLSRHALGSVISDDLRQVLETHSGRPLDRFFDQWVYHGGSPRLTVRYEWQANQRLAHLTIRQTQPAGDKLAWFQFPTKVRFLVDGVPHDMPIEVGQEEEEYYFALPGQPTVVRFDPEYTVLADVEFDLPDEMLLAQLKQHNDMLGRLFAARSLANRRTNASVEALAATLRDDPFYGVRIQAAESLGKIATPAARQALRDNWQQPDARVRKQVVQTWLRPYHPDLLADIRTVLAQEQNPEIRAQAIRATGQLVGDDSRDLLLEAMRTPTFREFVAEAAFEAIAARQDQSLREPLLATLRNRHAQLDTDQIGTGLMTLAKISRSGRSRREARDLLVGYTHDLRLPVQRAALRALGELGASSARGVLEAFAASGHPDLAATARQALRQLEPQVPAAPREVIELREQLLKLQQEKDDLRKDLDRLRSQFESRGADAAAVGTGDTKSE